MSDPDPRRAQIIEAIRELLPVDADDGTTVSAWGDFGPLWADTAVVACRYADAIMPILDEAIAAERHEGRLMSLRRLRHWAGTHQPDNTALLDRIDQQIMLAENDLAKLGATP